MEENYFQVYTAFFIKSKCYSQFQKCYPYTKFYEAAAFNCPETSEVLIIVWHQMETKACKGTNPLRLFVRSITKNLQVNSVKKYTIGVLSDESGEIKTFYSTQLMELFWTTTNPIDITPFPNAKLCIKNEMLLEVTLNFKKIWSASLSNNWIPNYDSEFKVHFTPELYINPNFLWTTSDYSKCTEEKSEYVQKSTSDQELSSDTDEDNYVDDNNSTEHLHTPPNLSQSRRMSEPYHYNVLRNQMLTHNRIFRHLSINLTLIKCVLNFEIEYFFI